MLSLMSMFPLLDFYGVFKEEFLGYNGTHLLFKVKPFIMYHNSFDGTVLACVKLWQKINLSFFFACHVFYFSIKLFVGMGLVEGEY